MAFDKDMLTPRGLLVHSRFVCQGPSFSNLIIAINNMLTVPHTKEQVIQTFGFSPDGAHELLDVLEDMLVHMNEIHVEAGKLKSAYYDVGDVCDRILVFAAAAPKDYDEIFDGLERLYKDEANNTALRNAIKAKIDARLSDIRAASSSATTTRKILVDSTDAVTMAESQLQHLNQQLNSDDIYRRLLERFMPDFVQIALNNMAINMMRGWVIQLKLTDETAASLTELQKAVGGFSEIDMDLVSLRKYIEENTEPGPSPILDLQKGNILEMWADLDRQVRAFKRQYIETA